MLTDKYEQKLKKWNIDDSVLAYLEKGKSNIEFAYEVFEYIKTKNCVALTYDVNSFFDGLDQSIKSVFKKLEYLPVTIL